MTDRAADGTRSGPPPDDPDQNVPLVSVVAVIVADVVTGSVVVPATVVIADVVACSVDAVVVTDVVPGSVDAVVVADIMARSVDTVVVAGIVLHPVVAEMMVVMLPTVVVMVVMPGGIVRPVAGPCDPDPADAQSQGREKRGYEPHCPALHGYSFRLRCVGNQDGAMLVEPTSGHWSYDLPPALASVAAPEGCLPSAP
jgi:hypothetical protein